MSEGGTQLFNKDTELNCTENDFHVARTSKHRSLISALLVFLFSRILYFLRPLIPQ